MFKVNQYYYYYPSIVALLPPAHVDTEITDAPETINLSSDVQESLSDSSRDEMILTNPRAEEETSAAANADRVIPPPPMRPLPPPPLPRHTNPNYENGQ